MRKQLIHSIFIFGLPSILWAGDVFQNPKPTSPMTPALNSGTAQTTPSTQATASNPTEDSSITSKKKGEDDNKLKFTDTIKTIRVVSGEYDVFFMNHPGPYSVPFSFPNQKNKDQSPEDQLKLAFKNGQAISVTVDSEKESLLSIDSEISERKPANSNSTMEDNDLPPELDFMKDILKEAAKPKQ